ncbi:pyruvate ferredoxin oxidoreductase [Methanomicrobiaceae archaeon CYW5]|uniref:transketolase C-terminal domain-containing protein n=1 Tax=Methanovulcanius yangii TaxID=1789227 RepID=UPI0029C9DCE8|nr:transketolase C-terminal domain-containing protein [Methanovulcanius yangii]MBT8507024.1 pyruvate ferredoxin oxidoreductase [Methanovulcanius yangii]
MLQIMEGSHAVAEAVRLCRPEVVSAYPITPQTHIVERLAEMVADGDLDAEYICVESEFSALSACLGSSAAGSRVYSATSSQGLMLMAEVVFNVAGMRQPIIMSIANRALGAPLSIWNDQQDSLSLRDSGWFQLYGEDVQEMTDQHFIAYKAAERHDVLLPGFVCFDGFILSHTYEPVDIPTQEEIDAYLPKYVPYNMLDAKNPISMGMYATPEYYHEFRYEIDRAMDRCATALSEAGKEFGEMFGRDYSEHIESYRMDDADIAFVALGSLCGTVKDAIDEMRADGIKAGLVKIRTYRPFPKNDIAKALAGVATVAVLEKNISIGSAMKGAVGPEVLHALNGTGISVYSYVTGLGGRDIRKKDIRNIAELAVKGEGDMFYGLREEVL